MQYRPGKWLFFEITDSDEFVTKRFTEITGQTPKEIYTTGGRFKYRAAGPVEDNLLKPIPTNNQKG